ncbi:cell wall-active antibiotics response protein LiaF [Listeria aquatica]|uniref:Cell wall-active antibiotics response protein n=1 Tax=Listeria aquatica TaxID=1494960 RepID=A0A841ZNR6_9LIST|nr:cell wall-active antibiotics response protein LiaF [Listeria aquatica]MBC1520630.1 cell wall-active antibiotics response protein [Listeria aquatica]
MKKIESSVLFLFIVIVALGIGLEMLFRWQLLVVFALGIIFLYTSRKAGISKKKQRNRLFLAAVFILLAVLLTTSFKIGIVIFGIFAIFHYINRKRAPELLMVETKEPGKIDRVNHFIKNQWFGNQRVLDVVYEWEDINIQTGIGDTIIDLGNTVLPTGESVIMIRSISGKIRLLVPFDLGICLEHSAIFGKLQYDKKTTSVQNDSIKLYSDNYETAARKVKIVTSVVLGDLEVIRL